MTDPNPTIIVDYDEFRETISDGVYILEDVLFVRAKSGNLEYHVPVFDETEQNIKDAKAFLFIKISKERGIGPWLES